MNSHTITLLAEEILRAFQGVAVGHCARVDYLTREQADALCTVLNDRAADAIVFRILAKPADLGSDARLISTDQAIEIRNRKQTKLCLFVPSDLVDAAFSSLSNAFAPLDGRALQSRVLTLLRDSLPPEAQQIVRTVFSKLRTPPLRASELQKLDFVSTLGLLVEQDQLEQAGRELWRVGLIADNREVFSSALDSNRSCAIKLAHPAKLQASVNERIASMGVSPETSIALATFFRGRSMNAIREWSKALALGEGPTFDEWVFPKELHTDLTAVTVLPFVDPEGSVQRYCKLVQPDGPGGSLFASYGPKQSIVVRWKTEPEQPQNLSRWLVEIIPTTDDAEVEFDLPSREIAGSKRNLTLKLDLTLDAPPDCGLCVRVVPLDASGTPLVDVEREEGLLSDEFFLSSEEPERPESASGTRRRTVPTLAFGRLEVALDARERLLTESEPLWNSRDLEYFSVRVNERRVLNIALSATLLELERRIIDEPRSGGRFVLDVSDISVISPESWASLPLERTSSDAWGAFWRAREGFFGRLKKAHPRDVVEVADWNEDLAGMAQRYAQAYRVLLEELKVSGKQSELVEALSLDTALLRTANGSAAEEALLIMPTHPLRAAWYANYSLLLRAWETTVLERSLKERKNALDLASVRLLAPANTPAFLVHPEANGPFAFFQNLRLFYGVALPSQVIDPQRRFATVATIVGVPLDVEGVSDLQPKRLAEYLHTFRQLHAYSDTLITTLVNADQGQFFTSALEQMLEANIRSGEDMEPVPAPSLDVAAYVAGTSITAMPGVPRLRQLLNEHGAVQTSNPLNPLVATTLRHIDELNAGDTPDAHLAVVADITHPAIITYTRGNSSGEQAGSFGLYGLITRFVPQFTASEEELRWMYRVEDGGTRSDPHPAGQRFGDTLTDLHASIIESVGHALSGRADARPAIEVTIDEQRRLLLESLHRNSNWVITLDRFFALDYYDSPQHQLLRTLARKYVIDYTPEFAEGLGHRMLVTTAWREEIEALLTRAMDELGFARVEESVGKVLHYLKTISGRLALRVTESVNSAAEAVGLGVVTAYLQQQRRLEQAILIPVDSSPRLFSRSAEGGIDEGERRCDLMLVTLKRNIVEATLIEVKLRRGNTVLESLARTMLVQMESSAQIVRERFFSPERVDGALQRAYLAGVIRFYVARARRYGLISTDVEQTFLDHLARLEKTGLEFRPSYEGYIVSLDEEPRRPFTIGEAKIHVITASDIAAMTDFVTAREGEEVHKATDNVVVAGSYVEANAEPRLGKLEAPDKVTDPPAATTTSPDTASIEGAENSSLSEFRPPMGPSAEIAITLGDTANTAIAWKPSVKGSPHLFIIGIPGQGKSWAVTRILTQLGQQGVPALVLDFHGQFAEAEGPFARTVQPTILDAAEGLPFSPFECQLNGRGQADWRNNSYMVSEIMAYVGGLGGIQRDVLYSAIQDAYKARGFGGNDEPGEYPTPAEVLRFLEARERQRKVGNVVARCRPILEMDLFKPDGRATSLLSTVRSGLVIDLHNLFIETVQLAAGAFVLRQIYKDMFRWGIADNLRLAIVLDEAHRLAKDVTLLKLMKEGRKYGIAVVVASQGMSDFHPDVLGNAGTKVIFRTNFPESRKIAGFIRSRPGTDLAAQIESLQVGQAYVQTADMQYGLITRMRGLDE